MKIDFGGKKAVVTGGANGIGFAMAETLARAGAEVWIFDLEREKPSEAAARIGGRSCVADVTDRASLEAAFATTGAPDVVMANAGIGRPKEFTTLPVEEWDRTIAVNLSGAFHTTQIAARLMKQRRSGAIVITASTNSFDGEPELADYNASKAGLLGLLHTIANELGPFGIRVNAICPGLIRTRLTSAYFGDSAGLKEYFRHIPLGRTGEPPEVAAAAVFLASDLASYITGATLFVDGGQMAGMLGPWKDETAEFKTDHWRLR
jgi:NAD(P)-dependent dehydrogenase (short-subunit alcohol dehydrogenase family)